MTNIYFVLTLYPLICRPAMLSYRRVAYLLFWILLSFSSTLLIYFTCVWLVNNNVKQTITVHIRPTADKEITRTDTNLLLYPTKLHNTPLSNSIMSAEMIQISKIHVNLNLIDIKPINVDRKLISIYI